MKILFNGKAIVVGIENLDLDNFPHLKVVGCNATSCEHLPLEEMEKRGIQLISLKDYPDFMKEITSTAEHTFGLILALLRNYKEALNGPYKRRDYYMGYTLKGKTVGIVGYGRIGTMIAEYLGAFGMHARLYDSRGSGAIESIWEAADIITVHIPLNGNEGFFTKEMFSQMKKTAYFINTSRSGIVENDALLWALTSGTIQGAAVDFVDDPALAKYAETHHNLILTNHIGGCTVEDREKTEQFITNKTLEYVTKNI